MLTNKLAEHRQPCNVRCLEPSRAYLSSYHASVQKISNQCVTDNKTKEDLEPQITTHIVPVMSPITYSTPSPPKITQQEEILEAAGVEVVLRFSWVNQNVKPEALSH